MRFKLTLFKSQPVSTTAELPLHFLLLLPHHCIFSAPLTPLPLFGTLPLSPQLFDECPKYL